LTGVAGERLMSIDVSDFVRDHANQQISFLITREVRWDGENVDDALTSLQLASKERGTTPGPQLFLTQLFLTLGDYALPGDYNHDGIVNTTDYVTWRETFQTSGANADGNQNGKVDSLDYVFWRKNLGHTLPGTPSPAVSLSAVPEPTSAILISLGALVLLAQRRSRRSGRI
jgi:hypothetical protein